MIAEYERAKIAGRTRRGKRYRAKAGLINVLSCAPYGFRYVKKTETSSSYYEIIEQEADVVRKVFGLYKVINLQQPGTSLDFLGVTFRYDLDLQALAKAQSASLSTTERTEFLSASQRIGTDISASSPLLTTYVCLSVKFTGKPDAGNPHVRFDEGEGPSPYSTGEICLNLTGFCL